MLRFDTFFLLLTKTPAIELLKGSNHRKPLTTIGKPKEIISSYSNEAKKPLACLDDGNLTRFNRDNLARSYLEGEREGEGGLNLLESVPEHLDDFTRLTGVNLERSK